MVLWPAAGCSFKRTVLRQGAGPILGGERREADLFHSDSLVLLGACCLDVFGHPSIRHVTDNFGHGIPTPHAGVLDSLAQVRHGAAARPAEVSGVDARLRDDEVSVRRACRQYLLGVPQHLCARLDLVVVGGILKPG
jgi:hypothetical protein